MTGPGADVAFKRPIAFAPRIWSDRKSRGYLDGAFFKVRCPTGYSSLSDACFNQHYAPTVDQADVWCINDKYLEDDYHSKFIWSDRGSGAAEDVSIHGGSSSYTINLIGATNFGTRRGLKQIAAEFISG